MTIIANNQLLALFFVAVVSFAAARLIRATRAYHIHRTARGHAGTEVQSMHDVPTPRIGGLAILLALALAASAIVGGDGQLILLSALPVFVAGLREDIGLGASVRTRLLAAMISGVVMVGLTGSWIASVDVAVIDAALTLAPIGIMFTIFATAGVAHAFNLVDGLNGLACGVAMVVAASLGAIALSVGDMMIAGLSGAIFAAVLGFFAVNYPHGRVFLGDAGAYALGHVLAWSGVLLVVRHPEISAWAILLVFFWPVTETLYAVFRRWHENLPAGQPDRMHFHHLVMRQLRARLRGHPARRFANPLATAVMAPLFLAPSFLAIETAKDTQASLLVLGYCALLFVAGHYGIIRKFRLLARSGRSWQPEVEATGDLVGEPALR